MNTFMSTARRVAFASLAVLAATAAGCSNHDAAIKEKLAVEREWLPFWDGKDCGQFHDKYGAWRKANVARIDKMVSKWQAIDQSDRDDITKDRKADFGPIFAAQIEITVQCGMGPKLNEPWSE